MSETSYFVKWKLDPDVERVLINAVTEGNGLVAATDDGSEPVFNEEHPYQQAVYNAIKGTTIRLTAKAAEGWTFKEWKNALTGRLYSTDEAITVEANGSLKLTAVFVDANQPVTTDETFLQWVKADYEKKTGVAVYPEYTSISDETYEIAVKDKDGKLLDTYTIDPKTGIGTNAASAEVNLPQTGTNGVSHKALAGLAALMGITGFALVKKSTKKDE